MEYTVPEYEVTVGSSFFNTIVSRDKSTITYEKSAAEPTQNNVLEIPIIKELGLTRTMATNAHKCLLQ